MSTLISIEGPAFTGKTSLIIPTIKNVLEMSGIRTAYGHEPGDSAEAIALRDHIYQKARDGATQEELAYLFNQSRRLHLEQKVIPFIGEQRQNSGVFVMDRFAASTLVFQGLEGGVPINDLIKLEVATIGQYVPDLYMIIYFPQDQFNEVLNARREIAKGDDGRRDMGRGQTVWHEAEDDKQKKRHEAYLRLPQIYAENGLARNFVFIDASRHPVEVAKECILKIIPYLSETERLGRTNEEIYLDLAERFIQYYNEGNIREIEQNWEKQQEIRQEYQVK